MNPIIVFDPPPDADGNFCAGVVTATVLGCDDADSHDWSIKESPPAANAQILAPTSITTAINIPIGGNYTFEVCCTVIEI